MADLFVDHEAACPSNVRWFDLKREGSRSDQKSRWYHCCFVLSLNECSTPGLEVGWLSLRQQRRRWRRWSWWTTWGWRACRGRPRAWSSTSSSASQEPSIDQLKRERKCKSDLWWLQHLLLSFHALQTILCHPIHYTAEFFATQLEKQRHKAHLAFQEHLLHLALHEF